MFNALKQSIRQLHTDDRGDIPVGTILVIAVIVLPILFMLITFREDIVDFFKAEGDIVLKESKKKQRPDFGG